MAKNKTTKTNSTSSVVVPENSKLVMRKRKYFNPENGESIEREVKTATVETKSTNEDK